MASRQLVILALLFFAVVGMVSASGASDPAPKTTESANNEVPSSFPHDDDAIGTDDGDDDAAPVGAPVTESTFPNLPPAPSPHSGVSPIKVSVVSGVGAAAAIATFFF